MPDIGEEVEGKYVNWEWCPMRKCWAYYAPHYIYPGDDGKFTVSSNDVWHDGSFESFDDAEREALGLNET